MAGEREVIRRVGERVGLILEGEVRRNIGEIKGWLNKVQKRAKNKSFRTGQMLLRLVVAAGRNHSAAAQRNY